MDIEILQVTSKKEFKQFKNFEWEINKNLKNWISPLRISRDEILNTKKHPFYTHAEIAFFLAKQKNIIVGRIAAITNQNYNDFHSDKSGFWGFFECINEQQVANKLFEAAAIWLRNKSKDKMIGPMNPSTNDEAGLLFEGFDTPPYVMMTHSHPYYATLVEGFGNTKAKDLYAWHINADHAEKNISEKLQRVSQKVLDKYNIKLRHLVKKNLDEEIKLVKDIYNNAWSRNWGFVPFTDEEIDEVGRSLALFADERMMFFAEKEGVPIAFSLTIPNLNEVLQKIPSGHFLPTGIFKLLFGIKKIKTLRVLVLGVKKEFQHLGLGSIFYIESIKKARECGYTAAEMSWILEDNHAMNRAIESVGSTLYKTYRVYQYDL